MADIQHLLLAAGDSRRMGQPKQLLPWGEKTLIEHQIQIRLFTGLNIIVVLGGNADKILHVIENLPVTIAVNSDWKNGMGSSLAFGISVQNKKFPESAGVLISLLDQPLVTTSYLEKMFSSFQSGHRQIIVSQAASGWIGVPALFDKYYYEELKMLNGDEGAKSIIKKHTQDVKSLQCDLLEDIDTPEAYQKLLKKFDAKENF